jgi:hypothetical protein
MYGIKYKCQGPFQASMKESNFAQLYKVWHKWCTAMRYKGKPMTGPMTALKTVFL